MATLVLTLKTAQRAAVYNLISCNVQRRGLSVLSSSSRPNLVISLKTYTRPLPARYPTTGGDKTPLQHLLWLNAYLLHLASPSTSRLPYMLKRFAADEATKREKEDPPLKPAVEGVSVKVVPELAAKAKQEHKPSGIPAAPKYLGGLGLFMRLGGVLGT
ncbi:hypothetical protein HDV00_000099 [Rhizophlyctis rosea]|nr:hypothetical protein HDV00_000099 [Rhizophlyctis rosea]